jgi:phospho-N-acetylmuramoyl-pentapeptide-transferase
VIALLIGAGLALLFALVGTPLFIRLLVRRGYGQFIRDDGPTSHHTKRGTPTMGGTVVVAAVLLSYGLTHLIMLMVNPASPGPSASALILLFLMVGMGLVGFLDDFIKISRQRSLGLNAKAKLILQAAVGTFPTRPVPRRPPPRFPWCVTCPGWTSPSAGRSWEPFSLWCGPT